MRDAFNPGPSDAPEYVRADRERFHGQMLGRAKTSTLTPKRDIAPPYVVATCSDGERSREDRRAFEQRRRDIMRANGFVFEDGLQSLSADERDQCRQDDETLEEKLKSAKSTSDPY